MEEEKVRELQDRAVRYFCERPGNFPTGRPYNCCESVLLALRDHVDLDPKLIPRIATGIGAGFSLNGLLCGCISSVAIVASIRYGRDRAEESPVPVWSAVDKYLSEFRARFVHVNCRELTGCDVKTQEGLKEYYSKVHDYACADRVRFAVAKASDML